MARVIATYRQRIPALMAREHVPGLAVVVVDGDRVLWQEGFGVTDSDGAQVTADTLFSAQSTSKTFTATAVMLAVQVFAWVRDNAADLHIDPDRVVIAGGSAGGHLALLAAYSREDPALTPPELIGSDPAVRAVVSLYGQVALAAMYDHTSQATVCHPDDPRPNWDAEPPPWMLRRFGQEDARRMRLQLVTVAGRCDWLTGGTPSQVPERYAMVSALTHVDSGCPATLPIHGTHDEMAPVAAVLALERALHDAAVPTVAVYLPHTDHMFDMVAWSWSPPARAATHVFERFLAGFAADDRPPPREAPTSRGGIR